MIVVYMSFFDIDWRVLERFRLEEKHISTVVSKGLVQIRRCTAPSKPS